MIMKDNDEDKSEEYKVLYVKWNARTTYMIAMLSWTMGLTNIFHVPYLIFEIGFWNFLAGYLIIMIFLGIPLTLVEIAISQYSSKSLVQCWDFCPFFRGVGYAKITLVTVFQVYYNVLNSYVLFYCFTAIPQYQNLTDYNIPLVNITANNNFTTTNTTDKYLSNAEKFWYLEVFRINKPLDNLGDPDWTLIYYLLGHMVLVFLFNLDGTQSLQVTLPLSLGISLTFYGILLFVANTVAGSWKGLKDLLSTRFNLDSIFFWKKENVLSRLFRHYLYSMGLNFGGFSSIASQGSLREPIYKVAVWTNLVNLATSIFCAVLFANFFGIIDHYSINTIKMIHTDNDFYNIFTVIPNGLKYLPGFSKGWQFVFYSSIYLRGLNSAALMVSTTLSSLYDACPTLYKYTPICSFIFCSMTYFTGCVFHMNYGPITGNMIRNLTGHIILPTLSCLQSISIVMIYGLMRFTKDLYFMMGYATPTFWSICLAITVPVVPFLTVEILIQYLSNVVLMPFEILLLKIFLGCILMWIPFMGMVRIIRKKTWKLVMAPSSNWLVADDLEKSRQAFEVQSPEEYAYETNLVEEKIKKYI